MALTDNLISYWKLDEASGTRVDIVSGNDLTDINTVASAAGKIASAADFERDNAEYLTRASTPSLQAGDNDLTIQAWVWIETKPVGGVGYIMTRFHDNTNSLREWELFYLTSSDRFGFSANNAAGLHTQVLATNFGSPPVGQWICLHGWHDAVNNQIGIAVNAGTPNTASCSHGCGATAVAIRVGSEEGTTTDRFWDGLIDEVGYWKPRVLSSQDRTDLYNAGAGLAYPFSIAGPATYVVGNWPHARVAARAAGAAVATRSAAARITQRNPAAQAAER